MLIERHTRIEQDTPPSGGIFLPQKSSSIERSETKKCYTTELLFIYERRSLEAKTTLNNLDSAFWDRYKRFMRIYMEPKHEPIYAVQSATLHVEVVEKLKEEAGLFQDATAVVRKAGEHLVDSLLAVRDIGRVALGEKDYYIQQRERAQNRFLKFTDTSTIHFNYWQDIDEPNSRAATSFDYAVLLDAYLEVYKE